MLVLSRKPGERIILKRGAEEIVVTIVRIGPATVRIGLTAESEWNIVREELIPPGKEKPNG